VNNPALNSPSFSIKAKIENHPVIVFSTIAIIAFITGWGAHVNVVQQSQLDSVPKGSYVLKEDIESGNSALYTKKDNVPTPIVNTPKPSTAPKIAMASFPKRIGISGCKERSQQVAKELQMTQFIDTNQIWYSNSESTILVDCGVYVVVVSGPATEKAKALRDRLLVKLNGVIGSNKR